MPTYPAKKKRKSVNNVIEGEFAVENVGKRKKESNSHHNEEKQSQHSNSLKLKSDQLRKFDALTDKQQMFFDAYDDGEVFMGLLGSAGTGKTFIALYKAIQEVISGGTPYHQVVLIRTEVETRESGAVPGDKDEKAALFEAPYIPMCKTMFNRGDAYLRLKEQKHLIFETTKAIRGMTFDNSIIVVDEIQNCNFGELCTIVTRVGENSKLIICGDIKQNDLTKRKNDVSGLPDFLKILERMRSYISFEFTRDDIVRSQLVKEFIIAMEDAGF